MKIDFVLVHRIKTPPCYGGFKNTMLLAISILIVFPIKFRDAINC